jgi:hypothetical protein
VGQHHGVQSIIRQRPNLRRQPAVAVAVVRGVRIVR